ncbi:hypothetical protein N7470_006279 [Penicillium chermesinum]|nr:hypothetical protein N7470_006279 [Penicillium chermesinum]
MFSKAMNTTPTVPSRNALRVLRQLALTGGTVGSFCTFAAVSYDIHRRTRIAEQIIENKRTLRTSAPNYDATASARRITRMREAAEAGEFMGSASLKSQQDVGEVDRGESSAQAVPKQEAAPPAPNLQSASHFGQHRNPAFNRPPYPRERSYRVDQIARAYEIQQGENLKAEGRKPLDEVLIALLRSKEAIKAANTFLACNTAGRRRKSDLF